MTPARALKHALACTPTLADEIPTRDTALSVLGSLGHLPRRVAARSVHGALAFERTGIDPKAALSGGARDDGGNPVLIGGAS